MSGLEGLPDPLEVRRLSAPPLASVSLPGSKSITNRALVCAALAEGHTRITGALASDDTAAMVECLRTLGVMVATRAEDSLAGTGNVTFEVQGCAGRPTKAGGVGPEADRPPAVLDARLSGTTSRFIAPFAVLSPGSVLLDGAAPLRERPMGDLFEALAALGANVEPLGRPGHLPVELDGGSTGVGGGTVSVRGDTSSQFLSGLLMAAPAMPNGLTVRIDGPLVSRPYVTMTIEVMRAFGARVSFESDLAVITVEPTLYSGREHFEVEPDASTASYFFALAAGSGGEVVIPGLGTASLQGDVDFVGVIESMGAQVTRTVDRITVRGSGVLHGIDVDMVDISDTAPTLAALAPLADTPTTVRGIGFVRGKETDRIAAVVTELRRLGIGAEQRDDGFVVHPGRPNGSLVQTYDDHRMAMSFAVLGLLAGNVSIADPGCVAKTFPGFWDTVARIERAAS